MSVSIGNVILEVSPPTNPKISKPLVISSFVFSIAHEPIAMALAFGGGCLYGWLRVKTGSIYPSMIAHAIWNGFITLVVIFA